MCDLIYTILCHILSYIIISNIIISYNCNINKFWLVKSVSIHISNEYSFHIFYEYILCTHIYWINFQIFIFLRRKHYIRNLFSLFNLFFYKDSSSIWLYTIYILQLHVIKISFKKLKMNLLVFLCVKIAKLFEKKKKTSSYFANIMAKRINPS